MGSSRVKKNFSKLHRNYHSPSGKFGFHVTTLNGVVPLINEGAILGEEHFSRQLKADIKWLHSVRGSDPELDQVAGRFFENVIPRLLRPLQSGGRSIKPTLVHGDIGPGNAQLEKGKGCVILYDSCCCYGHNERQLT